MGGTRAYLVDLISGQRVPINLPNCKLGIDQSHALKKIKSNTRSTIQFEINYDHGQYSVRSLAKQEQEPIYLNGAKLIGPRPINNNDSLKIGSSFLWFVTPSNVHS